MIRTSISWVISTFVVVSIATGYSGEDFEDFISVSDPEVRIHHLRIENREPSTAEPVQEVSPNTAVDLGALLDAGEGAVVTLVAGDTRLAAHRAVLSARSAVFQRILQDAATGEVAIPDVEGPVLRQLLAYLYTLQAPQLPAMAPQLLAAAHQYGLRALKADCEQQVAKQLSLQTGTPASAINRSTTTTTDPHSDQSSHGPTPSSDTSPSMFNSSVSSGSNDTSPLWSLPPEEKASRLMEAAKQGMVGELKALLAAGADVAARDEDMWNWTALHGAALKGHEEAARLLLAAGAAVDARDSNQWTPLHRAAMRGHLAVVRLLLDNGADHGARDRNGRTPLHWAAFWGHREVVAALLEAGADRAARDKRGDTPLDKARKERNQEVVELLEGSSPTAGTGRR